MKRKVSEISSSLLRDANLRTILMCERYLHIRHLILDELCDPADQFSLRCVFANVFRVEFDYRQFVDMSGRELITRTLRSRIWARVFDGTFSCAYDALCGCWDDAVESFDILLDVVRVAHNVDFAERLREAVLLRNHRIQESMLVQIFPEDWFEDASNYTLELVRFTHSLLDIANPRIEKVFLETWMDIEAPIECIMWIHMHMKRPVRFKTMYDYAVKYWRSEYLPFLRPLMLAQEDQVIPVQQEVWRNQLSMWPIGDSAHDVIDVHWFVAYTITHGLPPFDHEHFRTIQSWALRSNDASMLYFFLLYCIKEAVKLRDHETSLHWIDVIVDECVQQHPIMLPSVVHHFQYRGPFGRKRLNTLSQRICSRPADSIRQTAALCVAWPDATIYKSNWSPIDLADEIELLRIEIQQKDLSIPQSKIRSS